MQDGDTLQKLPKGYEKLQGLAHQIEQGTIPHAILLIGPQSVCAKLADELAAAILCGQPNFPCGMCVSCKEFASRTHPDFFQIQTVSSRIKTAEVGELQSWLAVRPHYSGKKVYVIHGIDTATPIAANRLLKTLEEPNQSIVAILTAEHASLVLPTIRSRCFQYSTTIDSEYEWQDTSVSEILNGKFQEDTEGLFARFLEQMVQWTETWLKGNQTSLVLADEWVKVSEGLDGADALIVLSAWLRDLMHVCVGDTSHLHFGKFLLQMNHLAQCLDAKQWGDAISLVIQTRQRVKANVALLLNIEQLCIRLQEVMRRV